MTCTQCSTTLLTPDIREKYAGVQNQNACYFREMAGNSFIGTKPGPVDPARDPNVEGAAEMKALAGAKTVCLTDMFTGVKTSV